MSGMGDGYVGTAQAITAFSDVFVCICSGLFAVVMMLHEQTATPVVNSRHLTSLSRHFLASVLSQEPREESRLLSHAFREDRTSQLMLERRQFDELVSSREDEKFEHQLLQSAGLWNLLISPLTSEKQLTAVVSPLEDAETFDVVALAQKALSASKEAALFANDAEPDPPDSPGDSLSTSSSMSVPEMGTIVRSKRQLERRARTEELQNQTT